MISLFFTKSMSYSHCIIYNEHILIAICLKLLYSDSIPAHKLNYAWDEMNYT